MLMSLGLALTACAGAIEETPGTTSASPTTSVGNGTTLPDDVTTQPTLPSDTTLTTSDRPLAPDFTLALGDGGTYTLSEGAKPVYLVFWAEW